ncbi:carboxymuconolactone decarboxylase family protein [Streptomyces sp. NBC_00433]
MVMRRAAIDREANSPRIGVEAKEIIEVTVHPAPYVGVPEALAALRVAAAVLREQEGPA